MQENWGKFFLCPMDKKIISPLLNVVLEGVLVYAQFWSKLIHGTYNLCFIRQFFLDLLGYLSFFSIFISRTVRWGRFISLIEDEIDYLNSRA